MRQAISNHDWSSDIVHADADESAKRFEEKLLQFVHKFIPRKVIPDEHQHTSGFTRHVES